MKIKTGILFVLGFCALVLGLAAARPASRIADAGSQEANITRLTARLLENSQFSHHRLDNELAARFLDRYLDTLDGARILFLQSDVDEFAAFSPRLAELTRDVGDTRPARVIFARYLERLVQQVSYVTNLLPTGQFDFTGHDQYPLDREHASRPRDLAAARELWRQRVRSEFLREKLTDKKSGQIVDMLSVRYLRLGQTMAKLDDDSVLELYLNALAHVYDPHSDYLGREQLENFSAAMNLSLFGIGATLQAEDGFCFIRDLTPGGPAARGGQLHPGDRIVAVAQDGKEAVDIVDLPLPQAIKLIRGPRGATVRLTVIPAGAEESTRKTVSLTREEITLEDQRAKALIMDLPKENGGTRRIGVIDLPSFYASMGAHPGARHESATEDVARLLRKLKKEHVQGVILDLRRNGGGSLEEAISMTGLFIGRGPVVQTRDPSGRVDVGAGEDGAPAYDGPLLVLTSRFSASASEILAGALQDYGRAPLVGDSSTFGKGTVQKILPLAPYFDRNGLTHHGDLGALKITVSKFYRPDGASTQLRGVTTDLVLPSLTDAPEIAESAMKDPLPWDSVPAARHDALNRVRPYLGSLRAKSAARVAADEDFQWLRDDLARLKKNLDAKALSLNESERRKESEQSKADADARRRARLARHETQPPTYEITVHNAATAGLPPAQRAVQTTPARAAVSSADSEETSLAENADLREAENILADYIGLSGRVAPAISQR